MITPAWRPRAKPSLAPSRGNAANSTSSKTPKPTSRAWINAPKSPVRSASVFESVSGPAAEQRLKEIVAHYTKSAPKLATWLEENLPQGFTVFTLPTAHQKRMRTSNALERVNQELKRRTRVARVFPNEKSLLRLITALLCETSDDWETRKLYLNMANPNPPSV